MTTEPEGGRTLLIVAAFAGAIVLAFAAVPQSLSMMMVTGPDAPSFIAEQFAVAMAGALLTGTAILLAAWWRFLLPAGAVGVAVALLIHHPAAQGITMSVAEPTQTATPPYFAAQLPWACLLVGSSGVLLIGVLGAVQRLLRAHPIGASAAGVVGCAGYFGVLLAGPLLGEPAEGVRITVVLVAVLLTVVAVPYRDAVAEEPPPLSGRLMAGVVVLASVLPTLVVAITRESGLGTAAGSLVGLVLVGLAAAGAGMIGVPAVLATAAAGLVLAAPAVVLLVTFDVVLAGPWWGWPLSLGAIAVGAAIAYSRQRLLLGSAALVPGIIVALAVALGLQVDVLIFAALLATSVLAATTVVGATAPTFARQRSLPAAGGLIITMAVGVHGTLNLVRISQTTGVGLLGPSSFYAVAAALLLAAGLLLALRAVDRVRPGGGGDDYRQVFTATGPVPPGNP